MRPDPERPTPLYATWRGMIAFTAVETLGIVAFWTWRDGFSWGAVLGGFVIGALTFATLAVVRRSRGS